MVSYDNKLFLFGGCGSVQHPLSDLWCFDIAANQWSRVEEKDPVVEVKPAAVAAPGRPGLSRAPTASFLGGKKEEAPATPAAGLAPTARPGLTRAPTASYLGGQAKAAKAGPVAPPPKCAWPSPRYAHSAVVYDNFMFVYAGTMPDWTKGKCVWKLDLNTLKWEELELSKASSLSPDRRSAHIAAIHDNRMFIYGGVRGTKTTDEVWSYDLADNLWTQVPLSGTTPGARKW